MKEEYMDTENQLVFLATLMMVNNYVPELREQLYEFVRKLVDEGLFIKFTELQALVPETGATCSSHGSYCPDKRTQFLKTIAETLTDTAYELKSVQGLQVFLEFELFIFKRVVALAPDPERYRDVSKAEEVETFHDNTVKAYARKFLTILPAPANPDLPRDNNTFITVVRTSQQLIEKVKADMVSGKFFEEDYRHTKRLSITKDGVFLVDREGSDGEFGDDDWAEFLDFDNNTVH